MQLEAAADAEPDEPVLQITFDASYEAVLQATARRDRLDHATGAMAADSQFTPIVDRLGCLRGYQHVDRVRAGGRDQRLHRFTGNSIGAFLGLVPSENSSGQTRSLGSITKTGNSHARRLLIEAAWHQRRDYLPSVRSALRTRWEKAPVQARLRGQAGNERLHQQWVKFTLRKKRPAVANVAVARELARWCWSLAIMDG